MIHIRLNTLMIFVTEHAADGRGSFASVEGSMPGRLLGAVYNGVRPGAIKPAALVPTMG